ncbi:ABC-type nitrate/sulfonate/bicarbonate transport system permease component [Nocardiopsis arvandica]|uniref:ABC-type nitrate/sulfonate/bicarbonate transport system permease component n=1 Tax=Nocardiopsis sinuspersici TaxID=501010 RepID=A0A7Z0BN05_9ACTN|nr:ABC transporter permease [Nocardiopsis sinuspersici]NYH55082.1 ABC-type nitrate/sulfonate/bicarbonate transport system permease component [Nocardiopsis sinuspersici]
MSSQSTTLSTGPGATASVRRAGTKVLHLLLLPALLIGLYAYSSANSDSYYMPTPDLIAAAFVELWFSERFFVDVLPSLARLAVGFTLSAVLGLGLGVVLGLSTRVRALFEPVLEFLRAIPPPVLVPLMILLVGIDDSMKVLVIVSGCVWPILLNTVEGVRAVDPVLADTARCYGINGTTRLRVLVLRSASPQIMAGLRLALALAIILMVISEMFASSSGLGFAVVQFQRSFAIPEMWAGMVLLGMIGFALSVLFEFAEGRVLGWYRGLRAANRGE